MRNNPLMQLIAQSLNEDDDNKVGSIPIMEAQADLLDEFLGEFTTKVSTFAVGQRVVLNRFGEQKYKYPMEGQLARISHIFDRPCLDDDGHLVHGEIAVVHGKGIIATYAMDFRFIKSFE